jgi:uncharacterized alpha-E superfamily protein
MAVLKSCSALEAFRKVHSSKIEPNTILAFLVLDQAFPRSIYFSVASAEEALWRISGSSRRKYTNNADRLIGKLESQLSYTTITDVQDRGLHNYLEDVEQSLHKIGEQIYQIYFAYHAPVMDQSEMELAGVFSPTRAQWSQAQQQQQQ